MSKSPKKRAAKTITTRVTAAKSPSQTKTAVSLDCEKTDVRHSKQSRVVEMLKSPTGVTIAAMMEATGWQQHSVRGFLAGVVRKKLRLKLCSEKIDGNRLYRIVEPGNARSKTTRLSSRMA
jgi:hypothetical protein